MYVPFSDLPPTARLWVYQASRPFTADEITTLDTALRRFAEGWESHGDPLRASGEVRHRRFVVLAVDEATAGASGCSIDKSVALIRQLSEQTGVELLDRSQVAFRHGEQIVSAAFPTIRDLVSDETLKPDTIVFDNTITTLADYRQRWEVPAAETWLRRYFKTRAV